MSRSTYYRSYERTTRGRRPYGIMSFLFDVLMTFVTGGFWLIWVFIREMRNR